MKFDDKDHDALAELADEAGIGQWDSYAVLASKLADRLEDLRKEVDDAEGEAESAR